MKNDIFLLKFDSQKVKGQQKVKTQSSRSHSYEFKAHGTS